MQFLAIQPFVNADLLSFVGRAVGGLIIVHRVEIEVNREDKRDTSIVLSPRILL